MCIICNLGGAQEAEDFLSKYEKAQVAMRQATEAMLAVSNLNQKYRKRYSKMHKRMRRISREWNQVEHMREREEFHEHN